MATLLLNMLVEIPEEQEPMVKERCQTTLAVRNQRAIRSTGNIIKSYRCPACMQLSSGLGLGQGWRLVLGLGLGLGQV